MKTLNKNQWIAVFASLVLVSYLLFSNQIMNIFDPTDGESLDSVPVSAEPLQTGFNSEEVVVGTSTLAEVGDTLTVHYVGTLEDGKVFDSSLDRGTPFTFTLGAGQVIRGWDEGLVGMRVGGKRVLTIAPDFGYGAQGVGTIPPNSTLNFEVELLNVQKPASR